MSLFATASCTHKDTPTEISHFCETLNQVNTGYLQTLGLSELEGHALVVKTLLDSSPASLQPDLTRVYETIYGWASAISGDKPMIEIFEKLSDPRLIGSEGRITDYIAKHCGIDLGGEPWVEAEALPTQTTCEAWPRIGTPLTFNNFPNLPDIAGSNYFSNTFIVSNLAAAMGIDTIKGAFVVDTGGKVVIRGQYPAARYFGFHPNDMDLNNLKTLRDYELDPVEGGVNPFRQLVEDSTKNRYTATLSFSPPPLLPQPNTSYVGMRKDGKTQNQFVMNLLRMYHVDAGDDPGSGGVPLPALSIYNADGDLVRHFEECDLFAPGSPVIRTQQVFPVMPLIDHRPKNPPHWTTSSNFDAPSDTLANADVQYLATHYSRRFGNIFVVRAKYLSAPNTRAGMSPATPGQQVRLYNLCTYNFWNGGATQCILENALSKDSEGYYTLVISDAASKPDNLVEHDATWLDWGPYLDGQLQYRYVYRQNEYVRAIASAAEGGAIPSDLLPYVPVAVACDTATFQSGGWQACFALKVN